MTQIGKSLADYKVAHYDAETDRPAGKRWVTMSNSLVHAAQGLSLPEKQIIMLAISKLDSKKTVRRDNLPRVRITASEMVEAYGIDQSDAYKYLKQAGDNLYERSLVFREQVFSRVKSRREPGEKIKRCRWIGSQEYHTGEGWMEMIFWPEIVPHLTALKGKFTSYQMGRISSLRSTYSWRLMEMLTEYADKNTGQGYMKIEIGDFCHAMEATEKQRENFNNIRRRIIEPAVKELKSKDGWIIEWEPIKRGRRVAQLTFKFARDPQKRLL